MHNDEKKLKFEQCIEQQFEEYYNTLGEGYVCSPIAPISQTYSKVGSPDLPPMGPNILPSSSNKHGLVDRNYEGYKTPICSPKSPKIISDYPPSYSYRYDFIEMCNVVAWEEEVLEGSLTVLKSIGEEAIVQHAHTLVVNISAIG
ncbi:unnamed protein product [Prunus armeniaca]|uniref:Uncharacterized protein n=1 Tax=Prunus armeniaca TaxID=36596 RepID=A0A6J5WXC0_PRUAR|nr:unnamed protein product [Prunus armeniaca]